MAEEKTTIVTDTVTLGAVDTASVAPPRPSDDLSAVLDVLADKEAGHSQQCWAAVRLQELVHSQTSHKHEAVARGALLTLAKACNQARSCALRLFAIKAIRSIVFKNDDARSKALVALAACIHALADAVKALQCVALGEELESSSASEQGAWLKSENVVFAMATLEEAATTIVAIVNRHEGNENAAKGSEECKSGIARALEVLRRVKAAAAAPAAAAAAGAPAAWPPSAEAKEAVTKMVDEIMAAASTSAGGAGKGSAAVAAAVLAVTPDSALQKVQMLQMMLS